MKKLLVSIIIVVCCGIVLYGGRFLGKQISSVQNDNLQIENPPVETGYTTYNFKNDEYGFKLTYPKELQKEEPFKAFHNVRDTWMIDASKNSKGTPIVSIIVYRIENNTYYPRYYDVELRIGASTGTQDIQNCTKPNKRLGSTTGTINGNVFSIYPIQDAAMMQYIVGKSYKILHNNICFALEWIKTGSNYRDEANTKDIPEETLKKYYDSGEKILSSFEFTK